MSDHQHGEESEALLASADLKSETPHNHGYKRQNEKSVFSHDEKPPAWNNVSPTDTEVQKLTTMFYVLHSTRCKKKISAAIIKAYSQTVTA